MTARRNAIAVWERESSLCFDREETLCLMHGIVISTPDLYLMAMPVWSQMTDQQIYDNAHLRTCHPRQLSAWGAPDMLHILLAYGTYENLRHHFRTMPALQFPFVCYGRRYFKRIPTKRFTDEKITKATTTAAPSHGGERATAADCR